MYSVCKRVIKIIIMWQLTERKLNFRMYPNKAIYYLGSFNCFGAHTLISIKTLLFIMLCYKKRKSINHSNIYNIL